MNEYNGDLAGAGLRFALVVARFNSAITQQLLSGARDALLRHGVAEGDLQLIWVPGAWELPVAAARVAAGGKVHGIVALGCVIRGETPHFDYVAGEAAAGLGAVARDTGIPVGMGVLTTDTVEQALNRAGLKSGNKGWDAALSTLEMATLFKALN